MDRVLKSSAKLLEIALSLPDGDPRMIAVCVHGGPGGDSSGPAGLFDELSRTLPAHGTAVARFSLRGSGDNLTGINPTLASGVADVRDSISTLAEAYPRSEIAIVAESMGATIAVLALDDFSLDVKAMALLWPALNLFDTDLRDVLTKDGVATARHEGALSPWGPESPVLGVDFVEECLRVDCGAELALLEISALVVQGTSDREVPFSHGLRASLILGDRARFVSVEGGDHGLSRPHERSIVVRELVSFLG